MGFGEADASGEDGDADGWVDGAGAPDEAIDDFAVKGLGVEAAFSGEEPVGVAAGMMEGEEVEDGIDSGNEACTEPGGGSGGEATGGAAAGEGGDVESEASVDDVGKVSEAVFEALDVFGGGAFLGGEDGGGAKGAEERVGDIAEDAERWKGRGGWWREKVVDGGKDAPAGLEVASVAVDEAPSACGGGAGTSIHGGASTYGEEDFPGVVMEGLLDEFADPVGGGQERIALCGFKEGKSGGGGEFDEGGWGVGGGGWRNESVAGGDGLAGEGAVDVAGDPFAVQGMKDGIYGAFSAIAEGQGGDGEGA